VNVYDGTTPARVRTTKRILKAMKKIFILLLILFPGLFFEASAQSVSTNILKIEIDGKTVTKDYKVKFLSDEKWIEAKRTSTGFVLPDDVKAQESVTFSISFGKHNLVFSDLHISNFSVDWTVGVDTKPYSEEFVKPEEAKTTKSLYYIKFEGEPGRLLTVRESIE
jgi:hypothetical protein